MQPPADGFKLREGDQQLPIVNERDDIQSQVIADIMERREVGIKRYGTALQPFNGRSATRDAYEEAIDLAMYLKQMLVEVSEGLLTIEEYQDEVGETGEGLLKDTVAIGSAGASLLSALTNYILGKDDGSDYRSMVVETAGDLLRLLASICNEMSIDMEEVARTSIEKVQVSRPSPNDPDLSYRRDEDDAFEFAPGQVLRGVHSPNQCEERGCVVHHPSDHNMATWPLNWRHGGMFDIKPPHFERVCEHGIGHPDPDDVAYWKSQGEDISVHGCDGCCSE
jgi:NTP pyrophosphatase (non-canonical NTP hydrolase)